MASTRSSPPVRTRPARRSAAAFVEAYSDGRRLKTLRGLTPYEFICQAWTKQPERFRLDPSHHMPGPNI